MAQNIGLRQFAKALRRDAGLLSRWETGDRAPAPTDVAQMLGKLGVTGELYDEIIELASSLDDKRWYATSLPEQRAQLAALLDFEREATAITDMSPLIIPGLLQTSDYTRSIMTDGGVPAAEISTRVAIRMGRREEFNQQESRLIALIGEAALRQLIGTPQIMARQLGFLMAAAERADVEIRVVPFDSGWHPALLGSAILLESPAQAAIYVELGDSGLFLHTRSDVAAFRRSVDKVAECAMSVEDSLAVIGLVKAGWESS